MKDRIWRCKDGRAMTVAQMDHINNSIAMIQRCREKGKNWRVDYLPRLELELFVRNITQGR